MKKNNNRNRSTLFRLAAAGILLLTVTAARAQDAINVLFIGNSYTEVNNLPQMTADIASSMGHTMTWNSNTPGGCTFSQHCTNRSMTLIRGGGWDFVVLQEQSQYPSFPQAQVENEVFPYAARLVDSVYAASPCAEPMFYMTWGRRDGDAGNAASFPVLGTYEGMDSMLYERYMQMAADNDASVCPVGRVWRYLRTNHPEIELYQSDGSHPSVAGTYAAACAFDVMFFGDDPIAVTHCPSSLDRNIAEIIRLAVHEVVYLHIANWKRSQPVANIELASTEGYEATLVAHVRHAAEMRWDFGDGSWVLATDSVITHTYADSGDFEVTLVVARHCMTDTDLLTLHIAGDSTPVGIVPSLPIENGSLQIYPNPTTRKPVILLDGNVPEEITVTTPDGRTLPYTSLTDDNMPAGLYLVTVRQRGKTFHGKFVKR